MAEQENYEGRSNGLSQAAKGMGISDRFRLFPLVGQGVSQDPASTMPGYKESPQTNRLRGFSGASDVTRTRDRLLLVRIYYTMVVLVSGSAATNNLLRIGQSFGILILIDTILYQR